MTEQIKCLNIAPRIFLFRVSTSVYLNSIAEVILIKGDSGHVTKDD